VDNIIDYMTWWRSKFTEEAKKIIGPLPYRRDLCRKKCDCCGRLCETDIRHMYSEFICEDCRSSESLWHAEEVRAGVYS